MITIARRAAVLTLAISSLSASIPAAANAAAFPSDACAAQHNDPIVLHRATPNGPFKAERIAVESVTVSRDGLVRNVALAHTSGDARFDAAALDAAKRTAFAPAARSCIAVESTFDYQVVSSASGSVRTAVMPGSISIVASRH